MSAGTVTVGAVVSRTVTWNVDVERLPCASVARQTLRVSPIGNVAPDARSQTTVTGPSTRSTAVGAVNVTAAPAADVASTVIPSGVPAIAGPVVSTTATTTVSLLLPA